MKTDDPKTNGCPPPQQDIHVIRDQIVLDEKIYFDTNVARVRQTSWDLVHRLAEFMNAHPEFVEISIEGHTDEVGTDEYNLELSQSRADAVRNLLVSWYHVDASRLKVKGFGKTRPIDPGHDEAAHQKNRRVEFIITRVRTPQGAEQPSNTPIVPSPGSTLIQPTFKPDADRSTLPVLSITTIPPYGAP